ncbi:MAG TPA: TIGR01777 family oxidoreductase [Candidatus Solibacter sp.]
MNITLTGASGLIGRRLLKNFATAGHGLRVLSRHAGTNLPPGVAISVWDPMQGLPPEESLAGADAVVHLAGEPVAQRWTDSVKRGIRESRVTGTRNLVARLATLRSKPKVLVCASAIGYYGSRGDEVLKESSPAGTGFLAETCTAWEQEAVAAESLGVRVVRVRIGIVLDGRGGALQKMLPPFRMGVGGKLGDGKQWMSWIHVADLAAMFQMAVEGPVTGVLNGVAPNPVVNAEFTRELAKAVHRPAIFPVPAVAIKLLFGEMAEVLLASQRVVPEAAQRAGFAFRFPELGAALREVLGGASREGVGTSKA